MSEPASVTSRQFCGSCNDYYEVTAPAGDVAAAFAALEAAADAHREYHVALDAERGVHIRTYVPLKRGNGYYAPKFGASDNGSKTLCGVAAGNDITWDEARYQKNLATVTCDECKAIRARGRR